LEAVRREAPSARLFQASSSEIFGRARQTPQCENTPMQPRNPYGAAKVYAHSMVANYRNALGMFACSGILYNHESPRRGPGFVTRKIARAAARIKLNLDHELRLGNLENKRDWGFAGDYVRAMWLMLQQDKAEDYVIGTGIAHSVGEFVEAAFSHLGLDWRQHVVVDPELTRPADVDRLLADASKAREKLGWRPTLEFEPLVRQMVDAELGRLSEDSGCRDAQPRNQSADSRTTNEQEGVKRRIVMTSAPAGRRPAGRPPVPPGGLQPAVSSEMPLKKNVQGVSFPRSGHHLLVSFLHRYFGCQFIYCEYYNHCQQIPCANPANNLQKSHDFDLELPADGAGEYLLQYRHPLYAITSNFFLHLRGQVRRNPSYKDGNEPVRVWREFAVRDLTRWKTWMRKWILKNENPRTQILAYEDLLHQPVEMLSAVAEFLCPSHTADRRRVEFLVGQLQIGAKRSLADFRHFDEAFFRDLEDRAREEIEAVGLPLVMTGERPLPLIPKRRAAA
jgi:hypothetical protein